MNIVHVNDPFTAQKILSTARFAVCTRMHSAILAATVHTPFISIGYGIKGLGFVQTLDLNSWYIDMRDVSLEMLIEKSELLMKDSNLIRYINKLNTKLEEISAHKPKLIKEITEFIKS